MEYKPFDTPVRVIDLYDRIADKMSVCLVFEDGMVYAATKDSRILQPYLNELVDGAKASAEEWSVKFFMK